MRRIIDAFDYLCLNSAKRAMKLFLVIMQIKNLIHKLTYSNALNTVHERYRNGRPSILNEVENATLVQRIKVLIDKKEFSSTKY